MSIVFLGTHVSTYAHMTTWWYSLHRFSCRICVAWWPIYLNHSTSKLSPYRISGIFLSSDVYRLISCVQKHSYMYLIQVFITSISYSSYGILIEVFPSHLIVGIDIIGCVGSGLLNYWNLLVECRA